MKQCLQRAFYLLCLIVFSVNGLSAQTVSVGGTVRDANGQPLHGVAIAVKDTARGTVTDQNGRYSLQVPEGARTLVFSYVGYAPKEVAIEGRAAIDVTFDDSIVIDDIVVIGYGTVRKQDLTGSVSSVSEKDFQKGLSATPDRLLLGKVAGVQITTSGGAPGAGSRIRIRGGASLSASNDPLIILDGMPLSNDGVAGSPSLLSSINPNDIESVNILKDASATAIYGSRASNGIIIITSKRASAGQKLRVDLSTQNSISTIAKRLEVLNADQITGIVKNYPRSTDEFRSMLGTADTDWQNEIYRNAFATDNNVSLSGAVKNVPYRVALGYYNEDGILLTSSYERFSGGLNLNPRLLDDHLKIDLSLRGTMSESRFAQTSAIQAAVAFDPTKPVMADGFEDYHGYFTWLFDNGDLNTQAYNNPVMTLKNYWNESKVKRGIMSAQFDYKMHFLPELRANLNLGYDYAEGEGETRVPAWIPAYSGRGGQRAPYGDNTTNKLLEFYLNYAKNLQSIDSFIDVTAGYTYQDWLKHSDFYPDYTEAGTIHTSPEFEFNEPRNTLVSFFGRINYTLKDRYLLTATVRGDGSSRFHPDNRWGIFPSAAIAWRISNEEFLKYSRAISDLKLRLSYGQTGQQDINEYYPYLARYEYSNSMAQYQLGDTFYQMYRPAAYDKDIKWETTTTYNAGLDFGFLSNRITGSVDVYYKQTDDLLNTIDIPAGTNFSNRITTNIGSMENRGVEFTLNAGVVRGGDWRWDVSFNATYNRNKITKLSLVENSDYEGVAAGWIFGSTSGTVQIHSVGHNMYAFYLYKQVYDTDGKPLEGVYADLNRDGIINSKDLYRAKSAEPNMLLGFSSNLSYKRWTLNFALRASLGNYVYNNMNSALATYSNILSSSKSIVNAPTNVLSSGFYLNQPLSDYYLENASFLKMDNLSLYYDFGRVMNDLVGIRASAGVQNVFTITKYSGIDPEISGGVDRNFYPRPRIFSLGLNFSF